MGGKLTGGVSPFSTLLSYCTTSKSEPSPSTPTLTTSSLPTCLLCRTVANPVAGQDGGWQPRCCFRPCLAREVVVTQGMREQPHSQGQGVRNASCLPRTHGVQLLIVKQTAWISPTLTVPQKQPFSIKLAKLFLSVSSALPLPSIFSSLANSTNVGKAFCQTGRDFASALQLPHVIFPPEAGKQFSHILLTSGQKSW